MVTYSRTSDSSRSRSSGGIDSTHSAQSGTERSFIVILRFRDGPYGGYKSSSSVTSRRGGRFDGFGRGRGGRLLRRRRRSSVSPLCVTTGTSSGEELLIGNSDSGTCSGCSGCSAKSRDETVKIRGF